MKALTMVKPWWFTALIVLLVVIWSVPNRLTTAVAQADKLAAPMDSVMAVSTERISVSFDGSQGNADSYSPAPDASISFVSADGRYVAFQSLASNLLVPGDTNGATDVFSRTFGAARAKLGLTGPDLTGPWTADDGGMYYLRQIGDTFW